MAFNNSFTAIVGATYTASQYNTYVRDNLTAIWVGTTAGDMEYYTGATAKTRVAIGSSYQAWSVVSGVPAWANRFQWASVYKSTTQSFSSGLAADITWNQELADTSGWHSTVSNTDRITAVEDGKYIPFVRIYWVRDLGGSGQFHLKGRVIKNAATQTANEATIYESIDATEKKFTFGGLPVVLTATQYLKANLSQDSGGTGTLYGTDETYSAFTVLRVE